MDKFSDYLIDELGGTGKVALLCSVSPCAVSQWRENGIPWSRDLQMKDRAPKLYRTAKQAVIKKIENEIDIVD